MNYFFKPSFMFYRVSLRTHDRNVPRFVFPPNKVYKEHLQGISKWIRFQVSFGQFLVLINCYDTWFNQTVYISKNILNLGHWLLSGFCNVFHSRSNIRKNEISSFMWSWCPSNVIWFDVSLKEKKKTFNHIHLTPQPLKISSSHLAHPCNVQTNFHSHSSVHRNKISAVTNSNEILTSTKRDLVQPIPKRHSIRRTKNLKFQTVIFRTSVTQKGNIFVDIQTFEWNLSYGKIKENSDVSRAWFGSTFL